MTGQTHGDKARAAVREVYGQIAEGARGGCCGPAGCGPAECGPGADSRALGYSAEELASVPEGADLGLGCGNPQAIAALQVGETVLDLGAGAGFDCFLAAQRVGPTGKVIGVDMTSAMISKARSNAERIKTHHVEFRLGEIESLPVADASVDVVISNCVINLSPDKPRVFREAFRVLKPGGRLAISDVVATGEMPAALAGELAAFTGCVAGAASVAELENALRQAGFDSVHVTVREESRAFIANWLPGSGAERFVASAAIEATKASPQRSCCGPACCAEPAG